MSGQQQSIGDAKPSASDVIAATGSAVPQQPPSSAHDDGRLAMKLQVEEGLPSSIAPAAEASSENEINIGSTASPPAVASLPQSTDIHQTTDINGDNDDDSQVAWNLQVEENDRAWQQEREQQQQQQQYSTDNVPRMGAAPYQPQKSRDRIGLFQESRRQPQPQQPNQSPMVRVEFPSELSSQTPAAASDAGSSTEGAVTTSSATTVGRHQKATLDWLDVSRPNNNNNNNNAADGGDPLFLHLLGTYETRSHLHDESQGVDWKMAIPQHLTCDYGILGAMAAHARLVPAATTTGIVDRDTIYNLDLQQVIDQCQNLQLSFREAVRRLPFCVRFQLERCLLMDVPTTPDDTAARRKYSNKRHDQIISIRRKHAPLPADKASHIKEEMTIAARKMIMVFIQEVLPVLLEAEPQLASSLTVSQLFADDLWESLREVKTAISKGQSIHWFSRQVQSVMDRAWTLLRRAEQLCEFLEEDLDETFCSGDDSMDAKDRQAYTEFIRKRSLWPMAEYRVEFTLDGRLLPKGYSIVNKNTLINEDKQDWNLQKALKKAPAESRRAIRELGWDIRDRLVAFSKVKFHDIHRDHLAQWCRDKPMVCGRRYEFLFDKGAGSPTVWFLSPTNNVSRNDYLGRLGSFGDVDVTKLGDRIGLAFTQTKPVIQLAKEQIIPIPELTHNGYKFSDGCGVIGWEIAKRVVELNAGDKVPGAVQIRLGGVKGMLSVKDDFPPDKIGIRPSMCKFTSNHRFLEVKQVAKRSDNNSLFSQALLIMKHLGVPSEVFLDLQRKAWADIALSYDNEAPPLLNEPIDFQLISRYVQHVVNGKKHSQDKFSLDELCSIIDTMEARKKSAHNMHLNCSVALMMGVVDEHNILEEGQVLVGNGLITGRVLLCRTPCNHPGDIQMAEAVSRKDEAIFKALDQTIIFSAKGDRPLADMLSGGDFDGDKYYIIDEARLVDSVHPTEACDFESQRENIDAEISFDRYFTVAQKGKPIDLEGQIDVFHQYLGVGEMVASSAEAWMRLADRNGPNDEKAKRVALVCQKSLDARKLACTFKPTDMEIIDQVLSSTHPSRIDKPRWRGGPEANQSNSILGALFDKYEEKINAIKAVRDHWRRQQPSDLWNVADDATIASEITQDTRQFDVTAGRPSLSGKIPTEILADITFGRSEELMTEITSVNFDLMNDDDRLALVNMVLHEYKHELQSEQEAAKYAYIGKHPLREYDVYVLIKENEEKRLAICHPIKRSYRGMEWRVHDGILRMDKVKDRRYRVASIVKYARILESLLSNPVPKLMADAMARKNVVAILTPGDISPHTPRQRALNNSQRAAVAAVQSQAFREGILAIQGPPGTGKTTTIVEMVLAAKRAIVLAPSNAAVANLARKLVATNAVVPIEIVVWGENCDESVQYLNPVLRHKRYDAAKEGSDKDAIVRDLAQSLKLEGATNGKSVVIYNDSDGKRAVAAGKVILCTLNTAGSQSLRKALAAAKDRPELCILDEAGQSTEAEFYIATTFSNSIKRLVVCGDPAQLPATVLNPKCEANGYGESFLSNLIRIQPEKVHLLDTQYRMDPGILKIANDFFYENRILSDESVKARQPSVKSPFLFISTSGEESAEEIQGTSWFNDYEARVVKNLLRHDEDIQHILKTENEVRMIVITPYKAQVEYLRSLLKSLKFKCVVDTVDSFQGGEGDIVIYSSVRTKIFTGNRCRMGFTDNSHRMCVALTRAKRVLRVVGDLQSFESIDSDDSVLRQLALFSKRNKLVDASSIDDMAWARLNWDDVTWKPTMNSRFHHCLKPMKKRQRHVAFHTLLAVATPDIKKLKAFPVESEIARWQTSALRNQDIHVTWLAKRYEQIVEPGAPQAYAGLVEAYFAGTKRACLRFTQTHRVLPAYAASGIKRDLSVINERASKNLVPARSSDADFLSWTVTSDLQNAIVEENIEKLPNGLFSLDDQQERVLLLKPPLLLESRSGTGKTNVLFQHAVAYSRQRTGDETQEGESDNGMAIAESILFVTVSKQLQKDLKKRYEAYTKMAKDILPKHITFFSLEDFLQFLLDQYGILDKEVKSVRTYVHYVYARASHKKLSLESSLIENEIGGVIKGSLNAAIKQRALNEEEYLSEKRSNIATKTEDGRKKRQLVYKEYILYERWKKENMSYDIADIVLQLISLQIQDVLFLSAYLDEVQDFSYATILLICSLAGRKQGHWVAAGDTAQMISPGCSFQFVGLKETLIQIDPTIDIPEVKHLKRNYRMTKAVLEVANAVLNKAKECFPGQIEYAEPEIPMKDFGFKVSLASWGEARAGTVSFGTEQAIVYAGGKNECDLLKKDLEVWTNGHPLLFSVLEAKGLEYDDVVVVFDKKGNRSWNMSSESESVDFLRNSRELYVAITRARKRVVVLVRNKIMRDYFQETLKLGLDNAEATIVLKEFEKETSLDEWKEEGRKYFTDERYGLAESCFNRANENAWSSFSRGKHCLISEGQRNLAREAFRSAAIAFYEKAESANCLDVVKDLTQIPPWHVEDNEMVQESMEKEPTYLPRHWVVKLAILVGAWQRISIADMKDNSIAGAFLEHRGNANLNDMILQAQEADRLAVSKTLPALVADVYLAKQDFGKATRLYIVANDMDSASTATMGAVFEAKTGQGDIVAVIESWKGHIHEARKSVKELLLLFEDPTKFTKNAQQIVQTFGKVIVRQAISYSRADVLLLHTFDSNVFADDVQNALVERFRQKPIEIIRWYANHGDRMHATEFATSNLSQWTNEELMGIIMGEFEMRPDSLNDEVEKRGIFLDAAKVCLQGSSLELSRAEHFSNKALTSIDATTTNKNSLLAMWTPLLSNPNVRNKLTKQKQSQTKISMIYLLLNLFDDPGSTGRHFGNRCMTLLGQAIVKEAVNAKKFSATDRFKILCLFDKDAFASEKPAETPKKKSSPTKQDPKTKPETNMGAPNFSVGERVRVVGLQTAVGKKMNGRLGEITRDRNNEGRYGVLVNGEKKAKEIREGNLQRFVEKPLDDDDDSSGSDGSVPPALIPKAKVDSSDDDDDEDNIPPLQNDNKDSSSGSDSDSSSMPELEERDEKNSSSSSSDNSSSDSDSSDDGNTGQFRGHVAARSRAQQQRQQAGRRTRRGGRRNR